jgi:hypothetical protein
MLYNFFEHNCTKLERLLDKAAKVCHGQTLEVNTKIRKLGTKKFYDIGIWYKLKKPFYVCNVQMFVNSWSVC